MVPLTTPVLKVLDRIERVESSPWGIRNKKPNDCLLTLNLDCPSLMSSVSQLGAVNQQREVTHGSAAMSTVTGCATRSIVTFTQWASPPREGVTVLARWTMPLQESSPLRRR